MQEALKTRHDYSSELMEALEVERYRFIHAVFDDVGKRHEDGMSAIVGYTAYRDQWTTFNRAWDEALQSRHLEYLHTTEYLRSIPIIGGGNPSDEDVRVILGPFISAVNQVITQKDGFGICVITEWDGYERLSADDKKFIRKPEQHSFEMAVEIVEYHVREELKQNQRRIAIQLDDTEDAPRLYGSYKYVRQKNPILREHLASICFVDDEIHPPIQAADMLGNLTLKAWRRFKRGADGDLHVALKDLIFPKATGQQSNTYVVVYDHDRLKQVAQLRREGKIETTSIFPKPE